MDNKRKKQLKEFMEAIGTVAETSLIFFRSTLAAGATPDEAMRLVQAFIAATLFGGRRR